MTDRLGAPGMRPETGPTDRAAPRRRAILALGAAFLLLNLGLLAHGGIRLGGDSPRYLHWAETLRAGRPLGARASSYVGYVAVLALADASGLGLPGVVALQLGVAAVAGVTVAALGGSLGSPAAGLVGAAFLLANPDVAQWHAYILSDSLYTSAVVLVAWAVWRAADRRGLWYLAALLVLVPAATLRPTGLALLPVAFGFWGVRGALRGDRVAVALGAAGLVAAAVLALSPRVHDAVGRAPGYLLRTGQVVYRHPAFRVEMPPEPTPARRGWPADLGYVARHPAASLGLAARRVALEVAHVRPYYSLRHNLLIVAVLLPLYGLAALGAIATWRQPLTRLLLLLIGAHLLVVAGTLADYDGRFLAHIVGPFAALAAAGSARLRPGRRATGPGPAPRAA